MIQLHNLNRLYEELSPGLSRAQDIVLKSGRVMLGEFTHEFEDRIARVAGAEYAAVVGSGSDALMYAIIAHGLTGFVCMPAQTYIATHNSIWRAKCLPICVDVDNAGLLDWSQLPSSNQIVWVGLFGNHCDIPQNKFVIEDGAQHFGAKLQAVTAAYSFDPTKALPNFSNGGAVVSNDKTIIERVRLLRRHKTVMDNVGGNSIMSERDCAEMLVKLDHFPFWQERRQEIARDYHQQFGELVQCVTDPEHQVSKFVIQTEHRADLQAHLSSRGIETKRAYDNPIMDLPQAKANCETFLQLPCDPYTTDEELLHVILAVKEFFKERPLESLA